MTHHQRNTFGCTFGLLLCASVVCASTALGSEPNVRSKTPSESQTRGDRSDAAVAALSQMHAHLRDSQDLKFSASFAISDAAVGNNTSGTMSFAIRKPNLFRVEVKAKGQNTIFVSDGTNLTIYKPALRKYTVVPARDTVLGTMYSAVGLMNLPGRILDFFWTVDYLETIKEDVRTAKIADAQIGGRKCLGLRAVRMEDRFDIWMEQSAPHLPCKLISRRTDGGADTIYTNVFTWSASPAFEPTFFQFSPPAGAKEGDVLN